LASGARRGMKQACRALWHCLTALPHSLACRPIPERLPALRLAGVGSGALTREWFGCRGMHPITAEPTRFRR
jgi:hypothetical protein